MPAVRCRLKQMTDSLGGLSFLPQAFEGGCGSQRCGLRLLAAMLEFVQVPQRVCGWGRKLLVLKVAVLSAKVEA